MHIDEYRKGCEHKRKKVSSLKVYRKVAVTANNRNGGIIPAAILALY
jgi:hypothetical protein